MKLHSAFAAAALVAAITAPAPAALAHARLVSSTPTADASVPTPAVISLTFSDRMVPAFSTFEVANRTGGAIPLRITVSGDGKTISGRPARPLPAGTYTVDWRIASRDGHRMTGAFNFTVR